MATDEVDGCLEVAPPPTKRIYFSASFEDGDPVSHQAKVITGNTWTFSLTAVEYFITTPRHTLKLLMVLPRYWQNETRI